ncbi:MULTISPECIES: hypothetical protein [Bacteroidota]|uniref:Uncharacterized protein n=2 Tax=Bacteroidota TaxID=976 RepID=A0A2X2JLH1_SPHMU|nr:MULTISPECIES: hypothetical protein [Bacteroidota]AZB25147.1 hypothetical protein EG339_11440 [Chryseobacterium bernardetii]QRQ63237.1 hypothetical protein I6J33_09825 [Sphingobacterium multivorum]SPZ95077.1 Uncharacterised protein [Sphingobacterium multivorum]
MKPNWEQIFVTLLQKPVKTDDEFSEMQNARVEFEKELNLETQALLQEIELKGVKASNIWDLVNTRSPYPEVIDILTAHLTKDYHNKNKEGIIRALGVREAGVGVAQLLLRAYCDTNDKGVKDAILLSIYNILKSKTAKKLSTEQGNEEPFMSLLRVFIENRKISVDDFVKIFHKDIEPLLKE